VQAERQSVLDNLHLVAADNLVSQGMLEYLVGQEDLDDPRAYLRRYVTVNEPALDGGAWCLADALSFAFSYCVPCFAKNYSRPCAVTANIFDVATCFVVGGELWPTLSAWKPNGFLCCCSSSSFITPADPYHSALTATPNTADVVFPIPARLFPYD